MIARLLLRAPEVPDGVLVEVEPGSTVLVGRRPELGLLPASFLAARREVRLVTLESPQVSGNHLLVEHREEGLFVSDLNARNGSWLRLVPGRPVQLPVVDITLDLARSASLTDPDPGPGEVTWRGAEDFAVTLERALTRWLQERRCDATVRRRRSGSEALDAPSFGLADGSALVLEQGTRGTLTSGWLDRARAWVHAQNVVYEQEQDHDEDFVMASRGFRQAHRQLVEAALRKQRLVILGETGSGKEVLARCYHRHSERSRGPFLVVNCGGLLNTELVHSELFGAVRGAYTSCVRDVVGAVEAAHGGTLVLDEIGDLPTPVQVALLRFLDSRGEYRKLGEVRTQRADVRVVSSTNKDLEALVETGAFRADLWYRLNGDVLRVPPLRERPEDLRAFLARREVLPGLSALDVMTEDGLAMVLEQRWPGNFRELENFAGRLVSVMADGRCDAAACRRALRLREPPAPPRRALESAFPGGAWGELLDRATAAWSEDHGGEAPSLWASLDRFQEDYIKPLFVAYACGKQDAQTLSRDHNFAEMARRLSLSDGSRAKAYLARYIDRFKRPAKP
jgi:DNA-binding NtrC family response regulator